MLRRTLAEVISQGRHEPKRGNMDKEITTAQLCQYRGYFSYYPVNSTKEITINKNAQGFVKNKQAAFEGGAVAGNARRELELKSGKKVISRQNYRILLQSKKL